MGSGRGKTDTAKPALTPHHLDGKRINERELDAAISQLSLFHARRTASTDGLFRADSEHRFRDARLEALFGRFKGSSDSRQWNTLVCQASLWAVTTAVCLVVCVEPSAILHFIVLQLLCISASVAVAVWAHRRISVDGRQQLWGCVLSYVESFRRCAEYQAHAFSLSDELEEAKYRENILYELLFHGQKRIPGTSSTGRRDFLLAAPEAPCVSIQAEGAPELAIPLALSKRDTDFATAVRAASRMRDPDYGLREFYIDMRHAFPELQLYTVMHEVYKAGHTDVSSGLTPDEEYCRTLGSLFGVYWLARIGIDGELGFTFGVDDDWMPRPPLLPEALEESPELQMRQRFYELQEWHGLLELLIDAHILKRVDGQVVVDTEMMTAMLVLTAIHDIFKAEALLPKVRSEHAPFHGFVGGDVINDHDLAMYYVLEHYPTVLPSFAALNDVQKRAVLFTQSKMSFNHGWLVQAEAPPHALFYKFKKVVAAGAANPANISFYFVHWLTDLAGALPTPLEGSEKLVLAFPHQMLGSFIRSFHVLSDLATDTETRVFESYLEDYWEEVRPVLGLGPAPHGEHAIALMRLVCQAQTTDKQAAVLQAWELLVPEDKKVLCEEMGRTGFADQLFERSPSRRLGGPAILVYYSPHLLRKLLPDSALEALIMLAEIYRRARLLWPLEALLDDDDEDEESRTVTIRVDQIKELSIDEIRAVYANGDSWLLCKRNTQEAVVECHPIDYLSVLVSQGAAAVVLKLWRRRGIIDTSCDSWREEVAAAE